MRRLYAGTVLVALTLGVTSAHAVTSSSETFSLGVGTIMEFITLKSNTAGSTSIVDWDVDDDAGGASGNSVDEAVVVFRLVTNVDAEHLDCYGDLAGVEDAFCQYLSRMPFYGRCVLAGDGAVGSRVRESVTFPCSTYGLKAENDFRADGIESHSWGSSFEMEKGKERLGRIGLNVPGEHNLRNSLGAAALANVMGVDFEAIARGLAGFTGVARRYERRGEEGGVLVIDDYAHHPAELAVAIDTAKRSGRRVVAVFQPHLFSRTRDLCRDFARELCAADQVFLADVYPSREEPLPGVDGGMIAREMRERGYRDVVFVPQKEQLPDRVMQSCRSGDLVLTLGAGDIDGVSRALVDGLKQRSS